MQPLRVRIREIANGQDAALKQLILGSAAYIKKILHRQRPHDIPIVLFRNYGNSIRLFVIAAQLGKDLVVGHPNLYRDPQLKLYSLADLVCDGFPNSNRCVLPVTSARLISINIYYCF